MIVIHSKFIGVDLEILFLASATHPASTENRDHERVVEAERRSSGRPYELPICIVQALCPTLRWSPSVGLAPKYSLTGSGSSFGLISRKFVRCGADTRSRLGGHHAEPQR